jgi:hypothetical protein
MLRPGWASVNEASDAQTAIRARNGGAPSSRDSSASRAFRVQRQLGAFIAETYVAEARDASRRIESQRQLSAFQN